MYSYDLKRIYIMLGAACNMKCKHCSQGECKDTYITKHKDGLSKEALEYCLNAAKKVNKMIIYFWGGEPLLYFKTIQKIVQQFKDAKAKNLAYYITTNGLLFTEEVSQYCYENNFFVTLSYDTPNPTQFRDVPPNEKTLEVFRNYKGTKAVTSSFCAGNTDLIEGDKLIRETFPNIRHGYGPFIVIGEQAKMVIDFKENEIHDNIIKYAKETGKEIFKNRYLAKKKRFNPEIFRFVQQPICGHGFNTQGIDCEGNIYLCHNSDIKMGHVTEPEDVVTRRFLKEWLDRRPPKCIECDVREYCWGHCGMEILKEDGSEYCSCDAVRETIKALIEAKEIVNERKVLQRQSSKSSEA